MFFRGIFNPTLGSEIRENTFNRIESNFQFFPQPRGAANIHPNRKYDLFRAVITNVHFSCQFQFGGLVRNRSIRFYVTCVALRPELESAMDIGCSRKIGYGLSNVGVSLFREGFLCDTWTRTFKLTLGSYIISISSQIYCRKFQCQTFSNL